MKRTLLPSTSDLQSRSCAWYFKLALAQTLVFAALFALSHLAGYGSDPGPGLHSLHVSADNKPPDDHQRLEQPGFGRWLDGCRLLYLDVGTNIGIQIRKLYEPELYPDSPSLEWFTEAFGEPAIRKTRRDLCAVGWEPNLIHVERLKALEEAYVAQGWRLKIFTGTAVASYDGNITFYKENHETDAEKGHNWGASVLQWLPAMREDKELEMTVKAMDLSRYMVENVLPRRFDQAEEGMVMMKMDVEGSEMTVIPELFRTGAICHVNKMFAEMHEPGAENIPELSGINIYQVFNVWSYMTKTSNNCPTQWICKDDEAYHNSDFPLPPINQLRPTRADFKVG